MPTYGYRCPNCTHEYDKLQKISDLSKAPCPECNTPGERLISGGAGLVFKGSGFYETDYKRAGEKKPKEEGDKAKPKSDEKSTTPEKKKDSGASSDKPAKKKETPPDNRS